MIPGISGGLTNSGSMPISASGGSAGDATAKSKTSFGGMKFGSVNFGGGMSNKLVLAVAVAGLVYVAVKK